MKQEQLAQAVGVSTPAVSKWETSSSYPDITLLAPIARALGTNVDTLLNFTPKLTEQQSASLAGEVAKISAEKGGQAALKRMKELLYTYPENPALQFHMASILIGLQMEREEEREANKQQAKKWFKAVIESGDTQFFTSATYLLASMCLKDHELDQAEELLESMPEPSPNAQLIKATLHEKRGDLKTAKLMVQTSLYQAFQMAETCLAKLMEQGFAPDVHAALHICEIHQELAKLMDYPFAMSDVLFAEVYLREGKTELAADSILCLTKTLKKESTVWGKELFSELNLDPAQLRQTLQYMRKMICEQLETDEKMNPVRENEKYKEAVKLLRV
jgi:transcriptional regulator with XRE-family HTH domain